MRKLDGGQIDDPGEGVPSREGPRVRGRTAGERWIRTLGENPTWGKLRLSGPHHQRNSTPNRGEIVSKKGVRASQQLIPSLARDTAPFIYLGTGVSLLNAAGLSEIPMQIPGVGWRGTRHKDP